MLAVKALSVGPDLSGTGIACCMSGKRDLPYSIGCRAWTVVVCLDERSEKVAAPDSDGGSVGRLVNPQRTAQHSTACYARMGG